ncbi:MAG: isopentenyl-diphosphate Delta-isomerase [Myxococcota bacterium]|jgi:isopentenyl-diphosphate delta-isomerase|nr:isopentenyl-diphosphate Delta-isomerase [Myxococcota bacterium]
MDEMLILVDENDNPIGTEEKMEIHRRGVLHRCFSIFVCDRAGRVMLQKRAASKYHSGGLWTNTCCGHPRAGEEVAEAAHRRLFEEMSFDCELVELFTFVYRAQLDHGLIEHEFDHVFAGRFEAALSPNPEEADGYDWETMPRILEDMRARPERYTVWSIIAFEKLIEKYPQGIPGQCEW